MNEDILDDGSFQLSKSGQELNAPARDAIARAIKWGKVYFYISVGMLALNLLLQFLLVDNTEGPGGVVAAIFSLAFLLLLIGYPIYKFYQFISKTPHGYQRGDQADFVAGIGGLKSSIKYFSVLTLVVVVFYVLLLLLLILGGGLAALGSF